MKHPMRQERSSWKNTNTNGVLFQIIGNVKFVGECMVSKKNQNWQLINSCHLVLRLEPSFQLKH